MAEKEIGNGELGNGDARRETRDVAFEACYDLLGKLVKIENIVNAAMQNQPEDAEDNSIHLLEALEKIAELCPPKEPAAPVCALPDVPKRPDWLELPRGITLQRFVNTKRETHFIGQYRSDSKSNQNPRRVYTIDVLPMWSDGEDLKLSKAFEVGVHEDGKLLFKITTLRGRANAEYLGVKAFKAWLVHLDRKSEECVKAQRKRHFKAHRAEYRKRYKANLKARKAAQKGEA